MGLLSTLIGRGKKGELSSDWSISLNTGITSQSTSGYLDEEAIVVGCGNGKVYAIDSLGKIKWDFSINQKMTKEEEFFIDEDSIKIKSTPIIADINKDNKGEVIFGSGNGTLYVLDHKGKLLWSFDAKGSIYGSACVADINNDKKSEILFGSSANDFYAITNSGKKLWQFDASSGIESQPIVTNVSAKSNKKQIIFGTNDGMLYSIDEKGKKVWEFKTGDKITAQPSIGNLCNNMESFIVLGSQDNKIYTLTMKGILYWSYETNGKIFSKATLADINNDKKMEIIFGSCDDKLYVLSDSGKKLWDYETNFWVVASPIVGDFNEDKKLEISIGSYDNFVYILESEGDYTLEYIPGISSITHQSGHYTDLATSEPGYYNGKVLSKYRVDGMVVSQNFLEKSNSLIVASDTGKVYKLGYKNIKEKSIK